MSENGTTIILRHMLQKVYVFRKFMYASMFKIRIKTTIFFMQIKINILAVTCIHKSHIGISTPFIKKKSYYTNIHNILSYIRASKNIIISFE